MPLIYCFLYTRSKDVYVTIVYVSIHLLNPEEKRKQIFREDVDRCRGRPSRVDDAGPRGIQNEFVLACDGMSYLDRRI